MINRLKFWLKWLTSPSFRRLGKDLAYLEIRIHQKNRMSEVFGSMPEITDEDVKILEAMD